MHRWSIPVLAALGLLALIAPPARAHGGMFRAPGTPPTGPGLGPAPVPSVITPGETWQTWWDLNRLNLLPGRDEMVGRGPITGPTVTPDLLREAWSRRRTMASREEVIPFLLRLLDPKRKTRDEVRAAALIALGKTCTGAAARPLMLHYLQDQRSNDLVRESAALGIGLLCRAEPSMQVPALALDDLREALIGVVEDRKAGLRVRAFAALGLGLLADQPYASERTEDGACFVRRLWKQLGPKPKASDLPVATLTAVGMFPRAGVQVEVVQGLFAIAKGTRVAKRRWTNLERSHAVTALARLEVHGLDAFLARLLKRSGEAAEVKRAAYLAIGRRAARVKPTVRAQLAQAVVRALDRRRDPLTTGLGLVALGRLLGADLSERELGILDRTRAPKVLFAAAEQGTAGERGFGTLAVSLAAQGAVASGHALPFRAKTRNLLLTGLEKGRGDDTIRAAYAVGLGLLRVEEGVDPLLEVVRDKGALPVLRGHAAVALGQIGKRREEVKTALRRLMQSRRDMLLRVRTALALALLGDHQVRNQLLDELKAADSEYHRSHVVIALGRLGDLGTVRNLVAYASDEKNTELARALAVVALGLIVDPEPRPSLTKLRQDANFPAATQVLYSAYAIF